MTTKTIKEVQRQLRDIGWPIAVDGELGPATRQAVKDFRRGYAFRRPTMVNRTSGTPGPVFRRCLAHSHKLNGKASTHYYYRSWKSRGNGWIKVNYVLLRGLEKLYDKYHVVIGVLSGYRDPAYNKSIGGATQSQHMYGNAVDPVDQHRFTVAQIRALKVFSGLEVHASDGKVGHVDVRHTGPNFTGGTPSSPTIFYY